MSRAFLRPAFFDPDSEYGVLLGFRVVDPPRTCRHCRALEGSHGANGCLKRDCPLK